VAEHLELQLADGRQDGAGVTEVRISQHLHHALLVQLVEASTELLGRPVSSGVPWRRPRARTGGSAGT
jgi:hypothetical protein